MSTAERLAAEVPLPEPAQAQRFYCNKCGNVGEGPGYSHQRRDGSECSYMASTHGPYYTADQLREHGRQCAQAERERCAQVVEQFPHWLGNQGRAEIAAAIRSQNLIKE